MSKSPRDGFSHVHLCITLHLELQRIPFHPPQQRPRHLALGTSTDCQRTWSACPTAARQRDPKQRILPMPAVFGKARCISSMFENSPRPERETWLWFWDLSCFGVRNSTFAVLVGVLYHNDMTFHNALNKIPAFMIC